MIGNIAGIRLDRCILAKRMEQYTFTFYLFNTKNIYPITTKSEVFVRLKRCLRLNFKTNLGRFTTTDHKLFTWPKACCISIL